MPLRPDTPLQSDDLLEKLSRLGYREAQHGVPAQPGEYAVSKSGVEHLHARLSRIRAAITGRS